MRRKRLFSILAGIFLVFVAAGAKLALDYTYRLPVLMYHSIDYTADKSDRMMVSPEIFKRQMKYLHENHYNVIPLEKAVEYIEQKKRPPPKTPSINPNK